MIRNAKICSPTFSYSGSKPPETFLTTNPWGWWPLNRWPLNNSFTLCWLDAGLKANFPAASIPARRGRTKRPDPCFRVRAARILGQSNASPGQNSATGAACPHEDAWSLPTLLGLSIGVPGNPETRLSAASAALGAMFSPPFALGAPLSAGRTRAGSPACPAAPPAWRPPTPRPR